MKKVLHISTGGTISCISKGKGLFPSLSASQIDAYCPEIEKICHVDYLELFNLDSTNISSPQWLKIALAIKENYDDYDGFVITHGTDTMAYTIAAMNYLIQNSKKPIVFTGSQKPINEVGTDAIRNVTDAFRVASDGTNSGICLVFSGIVIAASRARKMYTKSFFAFDSINYPVLAKIVDDRIVRFIYTNNELPVKFYDNLNPNVCIVKLFPGFKDEVLEHIINSYDGLVFETFGVGGIPEYSNFYQKMQKATEQGKVIVLTTQVYNEGSNLSLYKVGANLKENLNILEAYDMTSEAAMAKLAWILGQSNDFTEIKKMFYTPIGNDILYAE